MRTVWDPNDAITKFLSGLQRCKSVGWRAHVSIKKAECDRESEAGGGTGGVLNTPSPCLSYSGRDGVPPPSVSPLELTKICFSYTTSKNRDIAPNASKVPFGIPGTTT